MQLKLGLQPFWFWNGDMSEAEVTRQIEEMAEQGIPGFMIHSRQGMELPYFSETFFDRVKLAISLAKKHDMEVWLYDEYPYPSGTSGGRVMLDHPEYACKIIEKVEYDATGGEDVSLFAPWGKVLSARAYPVVDGACQWDEFHDLIDYIGTGYQQEIFQFSGLTEYNSKRYFKGDLSQQLYWTAPEGDWKIFVFVESLMKDFKYFEHFVDPLNPDAIRYFIETTHEVYKREIGDEFGKTVKGIFTDEIAPHPVGRPWSPLLPDLIMEKHGIDILEYLPILYGDMGEETTKVRFAYWDTVVDQFIQCYDKQVMEWCEDNDLLYIGEKPILRSKQLEYYHIPGTDAGHQKVGSKADLILSKYRANNKMISSAAHFYDKPAALCEAYHSIGWSLTMQDMKWIMDWLLVGGVDWYVVHGYFFTTDGLKKHDAPASPYVQMPYWPAMHQLSSYADMCSEFSQTVDRTVKILVVDPVTSHWTENREITNTLSEDFAALQRRMLEYQLDYYIIDPQLFATATVKDGKLSIKGEEYAYVVLPPMINLEDSAFDKVKEYAESGGVLGMYGSVPWQQIQRRNPSEFFGSMLDISPEILYQEYLAKNGSRTIKNSQQFYSQDMETFVKELASRMEQMFRITPVDQLGFDDIVSITGVKEDGTDVIFLSNLSDSKRMLTVTFEAEDYTVTLAPLETKILTGDTLKEQELPLWKSLSLEGEHKQSLNRSNVLRLGMWDMELTDGQKKTVDSFPFIDQLEQFDLSIPVKLEDHFGTPKKLEFVKANPVYRNKFLLEFAPDKGNPIHVVYEPETFLGDWTLKVNGHILTEEDFKSKFFYLETNQAAEITPYLKQGENLIELEIEVEVSFGGIRNPMYIMGDFSVTKKGDVWQLGEPMETGYIKDYLASGIPFFAGTITYQIPLEGVEYPKDAEEVLLAIEDLWLQDNIRLSLNGTLVGECAWSPYEFKVPTSLLKKSDNIVTLELDTSLIGLFEGQYWNREEHRYITC